LSEDVLVTRDERGNISVLTMVYRPYNLLGPKLINAIVEQIEAAQKAGSRAIVLRSGLRHFSAGADLDIFDERVAVGAADQSKENRRLTGVEFLRVMELLPIPLISSVHGVCLGGGLELALACDLRIAAGTIALGMPPAKLGLVYSHTGIRKFIDTIGAPRTRELFLVGRRIDARTAREWGLVNAIAENGRLVEEALELAKEIAANAPLAQQGNKRVIRAVLSAQGAMDPDTERELIELRRACFASEDFHEGVRAFAEKRPPEWRGR
jgi:enoyl-CoA hydratase/carnithine racemase